MIMSTINSQYPTSEFTIEKVSNGSLPFLDVMLTRKNGFIDFSDSRKPTITERYITRDSYCSKSTKIASFNSRTYRLCRLPLSINNYKKELNDMKNIAVTNGYTHQ